MLQSHTAKVSPPISGTRPRVTYIDWNTPGPSSLLNQFPSPSRQQAWLGRVPEPERERAQMFNQHSPVLLLPVFLSTGNPLQDDPWESGVALLIYRAGAISETSPADN